MNKLIPNSPSLLMLSSIPDPMLTDPIADMLTRIRNAGSARKVEVVIPYSNLKEAVAKVLKQYQLIGELKVSTHGKKKDLVINLNYDENGKPQIEHIRRISKPGRRVFIKAKNISSILGGYGISIISTPQGVMSDLEAKQKGLGGEVLGEVW